MALDKQDSPGIVGSIMAANLNKHHLWKLTRVRSVQKRDTLGHWVVVVGVRACWGKTDLCLAVHDRRSPCPPTTSILLGWRTAPSGGATAEKMLPKDLRRSLLACRVH